MYALGPSFKRMLYKLYYRQQIGSALKSFKLTSAPKLNSVEEKFAGHLNELLLHYLTTYTLPDMLRGEDRCSMAHLIEARIPFTDYRFVLSCVFNSGSLQISRGLDEVAAPSGGQRSFTVGNRLAQGKIRLCYAPLGDEGRRMEPVADAAFRAGQSL